MLRFTLALALLFSTASAQDRSSITGIITDAETGKPLAGAIVVASGTAVGTNTSASGEFLLTVPAAGTIDMEFRYIGYTTVRRTVDLRTDVTLRLSIALQPTVLPGQTIVVTATRARERETPATFSTLDARELASRYSTQDIPQLLSELPSTTWYSENGNGIGYNYLNIRGFDQRRISVMINGIPQNDPEDHDVYWLDFPDLVGSLQDIQVQRGGGSAFYGPPAIGGSVNLITTTFSRVPAMDFYSGYGGYNTRKLSAAMNSGLVAGRYLFFGRLARITSDGYRDRSWTDFGSYFLGAVRFDETMTTQVNFYGGPISDHLAYYGIPKVDACSADESRRRANPIARPEEIENFSQPHAEVLHEWRLSDRLTLNNAIFYVSGSGFYDYDGTWAPYSYFRITSAHGFPVGGDPDTLFIPGALIRAYVDNTQFGWLPRLQWSHEDGVLTAGIEWRRHRSLHWGALRWGDALPAGVATDAHYYEYRGAKDILSVHAQELYHLRPEVSILLGVQYVRDRYRLYDERFVGTEFTVPYAFLNPKVGINWNLSEAFNAYLQVAHTSHEPRLKNLYDAAEASRPTSWGAVRPQFAETTPGVYDFSRPLVKPEVMTSLELGSAYMRDNVRASANLYWMEFRDEIIPNGQLDRFGEAVTGNADRTRHVGLELAGRWELIPGLALDGSMTLSRNRLVHYLVYETDGARKLDGNAVVGFPDRMGNVRVSYRTSRLAAGCGMQYVGESYTDNLQDPDGGHVDPSRRLDAYSVWNLWCSFGPVPLGGAAVEVQLQVNNLFNLRYASHGDADQFFPAATRNGFASVKVSL